MADEETPKTEVTRIKLWASGGCTGWNDYLMSDGSIQTLKANSGWTPNGGTGSPNSFGY